MQARRDGGPPGGALQGSATTIGVIATDARLSKPQATKLAQIAHDGLARAIQPVHTVMDGDVLFALATGAAEVDGDMRLVGPVARGGGGRAVGGGGRDWTWLGALPAEVVARAVVAAARRG